MSWTTDRHLLITGASSGIGRELARRLAGRARRLTLVARNHDGRLDAVAAELRKNGGAEVAAHALDVLDHDAAEELVAALYDAGERVDAFVNCAGGSHHCGPFESLEHRDIDRIVDTNAKAPVHWLRALLPRMKEHPLADGGRKRAHVLLLSSRSGERALPGLSVYAVAKAAARMLVDAARTEYAGHRIAFTSVCPGSIRTDFVAEWPDHEAEAHNAVSMTVEESVEPILAALDSPFAVNHISYQSTDQWLEEPGVHGAHER